jgi:hypothetical protein
MQRKTTTKFIGLDVHKNTITVAIASEGSTGEVRSYGTIENTNEAVGKVVSNLMAPGTGLRMTINYGRSRRVSPSLFQFMPHLSSRLARSRLACAAAGGANYKICGLTAAFFCWN